MNPRQESQKQSDLLTGQSIVITGTLEKFNRTEIERIIKSHGGKTSSSVSKNTSFILIGTKPGSKLDKANKLGIEVIDEEKFLKILDKASQ